MTLEEAIKHAEEVAVEQDKLRKRYDDASGYSRSHIESLRVTDSKKCEKCADEHRQLAEWLKDYKRLLDNRCQQNVDTIKTLEQEPCEDCISRQAVIELCEGWWLGHTKEDDFATEVRALPSVKPTQNISIQITEREKYGRFN